MGDEAALEDYESSRHYALHEYMIKPWSVSYLYDSETSHYRVSVPELGIETMAPSREAGAMLAENLLWTHFEGCYDDGTLSELPEPRVSDGSE